MGTSGISSPFELLSRSSGQVAYVLLDRSPLGAKPKPHTPLDLHVAGTPLAFALSQDQTLHRKSIPLPFRAGFCDGVKSSAWLPTSRLNLCLVFKELPFSQSRIIIYTTSPRFVNGFSKIFGENFSPRGGFCIPRASPTSIIPQLSRFARTHPQFFVCDLSAFARKFPNARRMRKPNAR